MRGLVELGLWRFESCLRFAGYDADDGVALPKMFLYPLQFFLLSFWLSESERRGRPSQHSDAESLVERGIL